MSNKLDDISYTSKTLLQSLRTLWVLIKSLNRLIPHFVFASLLTSFYVIWLATVFSGLKIGILVCVIVLTSIIIFISTKNYGEASVALAAGLLALLTVEWTTSSFIAFFAAWLGFTLGALLIASLDLSIKFEDVTTEAASAITNNKEEHKQMIVKLQEIARKDQSQLGLIAKMEVLKILAYKKLSLTAMENGLKAVELMSVISGLDHKEIAIFIADLYRMFAIMDDKNISERRYTRFLDLAYNTMRESVASPAEFITAFNTSRYIALSAKMDTEVFFEMIQQALENGAKADKVDEYIAEYLT